MKKFQDVSNFAVSAADLHGILAPDEFKLEKLYVVPCSENYNSKTCLYMKILLTCVQVQGQENLQNTTVNIYLYRSLYLL